MSLVILQTNPTLKWVCISGGPKLENCPTDMKPALKLPALQLTEQTGKGQSAGQSNRCLLHHSDLRVIDFFSLWREGVDGLKVLPKGVEKKGKKEEGEKGRRKGVWKMEREAESSSGGCHLPAFLTLPEATRWRWPAVGFKQNLYTSVSVSWVCS